MPSLLPGYEYDIFISYRQNDNRSGWVTEFVRALEEELSATIKEPVSVYFDSNPHDGLLETHNVDKSLEGKLKCLIFIPIISQTYCDTKSFAWQQEFCAFNKRALGEQYGRDIKVSTGNIASRILPVKIHSLDADDQKTLEGEMASVLRSIEFIYKEPGVNRPLTSDDDPTENLNKTKYRNQVNKVANAVKEILQGLKNFGKPGILETTETTLVGKSSSSGKSIVVLPFEDLSHEKDQDYFCDGLSEEIIASLARIKGLRVVSRTSSMHYKGAKKPLAQITQELGVKYVLEGSVRKQAKSLKITVQLIEAELDSHLWSDKYNGTLEDIFDIQETMAAEIVKALRVQLTDEEDTGLRKRYTNSAEAHELYLRGNHYLWMVTPESVNKAIGYFEKALEIDPRLALAYAGLAMAYNGAAWFEYFDPKEAFSKARQHATRAVEIDDTLAEAYSCLGYNNCLDWNLSLAEQQLKRACELKPNFADAHMYYAWYLGGQGRIQEALDEMKLALLLDPVSLIINANMTFPYYWMKKHDQAIAQALNAMKLEPTFYLAHWFLGVAYAQAGAYEKAIGAFEKAVTFSGGGPYYQAWLGHAYAASGNKEKAKIILEDLTLLSTPKKSFSYQIMILHLGLGNLKEAMRWLEVAYSERAPLLWYLKIDPYVEPLRSNTRFKEMLRGMGFLVEPGNSTTETFPSGKSIVVIPFENISPDKDSEYFSDGLTEEVITDLSKVKELSIISRGSAMTFKGTRKKAKEISTEVNVRYLLEGSVRKDGNNLRITAQLIDGVTDVQIWAEKYSGTMDNIFEFQEKLSRSIVSALKLHLTPDESHRLSLRPVSDTRAYECYIRARQEMWKLTGNGLSTAIVQLERGLELGGKNATIYATLATTYFFFHHFGLDVREEMLIKANENAVLSLGLDPNCAQGLAIKGMVQFKLGNLQEAVRTFKKALAVDPTSVDALLWISVSYCLAGRPEHAKPYSEKLLQIDPLNVISKALPGWIEYYSGNLRTAIPLYDRWLKLDPDGPFTRWCCGAAYSYVDVDRSCELLDSIIRDMPQLVFAKHALFMKAALKGNKEAALLHATSQLKEEALTLDYLRIQMAMGFALIDEKEEAVWWMRKSLDGGFINYPLWAKDPFLDRLKGYPPYSTLMAEMKVKWENFEASPETSSRVQTEQPRVIPINDKSMVVLPFINMSSDPEQEYFSDGLSEEMINVLAKIPGLKVIARTSAFSFKGKNEDARQIGEKLNVSYLLEGSVRKSDNTVRITCQFIRASDGIHVWSETYDRQLVQILTLQSEIARNVAGKLELSIFSKEGSQHAIKDQDAYLLTLKGNQVGSTFSEEALKEAKKCFLEAIAKDTQYAPAHAGLAFAALELGGWNTSGSMDFVAEARSHALQALKLDHTLAEAQIIIARIYFYEFKWAEATLEFQKAISLKPNVTPLRMLCGNFLTAMGRFDESIAFGLHTIELDPLSAPAHLEVGWAYFHARRISEAADYLERGLRIDNHPLGLLVLGWLRAELGEVNEAKRLADEALRLTPQVPTYNAFAGFIYGKSGDKDKALEILAHLRELEKKGKYVSPVAIACLCMGLSDKEMAITELKKAIQKRDILLVWLKQYRLFDPVRSDPRFQEIMRQMNFPE